MNAAASWMSSGLEERYQKRYGFWRPVAATSVEKVLACGDLKEGFARVRCPTCRFEFFVALGSRGDPEPRGRPSGATAR
jgi:hypothetical protein